MKIRYQFATETVEVEVSEELGNIIVDLDRQEYNNHHKETRRHCSLDAFNLDDALFPSEEDIEAEVVAKDQYNRLYAAIALLEPQQKELVRQVFFEDIKNCGHRSRRRRIGSRYPQSAEENHAALKKF